MNANSSDLRAVSPEDPGNLTELIHRSRAGDAEASDALFEATYGDLRRLARARLRAGAATRFSIRARSSTNRTCASPEPAISSIEDRVHFMRWAGCVMRSVIVDVARRRASERRGGGAARVPLDVDPPAAATGAEEILRVHEALDRIGMLDARMRDVVEMRYFGGLTEPEIASALGVTARTVRRDWEKARLLLREALK